MVKNELLKNCIKIKHFVCKYLKYIEFNKTLSKNTCKAYCIDLRQLLLFCTMELKGTLSQKQQKAFLDVSQNETLFAPESDLFLVNTLEKPLKTGFKVLKGQKSQYKQLLEQNVLLQHPENDTLVAVLESLMKKVFKSWLTLAPATRHRKYACLKAFFSWLFTEGIISKDLQATICLPKVPQKIPHYLSVDEALHLIKTIQKTDKKSNKKPVACDLMLILLLYGGGLRVSEACNMKWRQVDFTNEVLRIKGKGDKERIVAVPSLVIKTLKQYQPIKVHAKKPATKNQLAKKQITKTGITKSKPLNDRIFPDLYPRKAFDIVRYWGHQAGLNKPLSPHVLRHSFATHLLSSGSDLRSLQELLGHQSLRATQKYTHLHISHLSRLLETRHPLQSVSQKKPSKA